jgi:hypothetical protein
MSGDTKRSDLARAEDKGLKVTYRIRRLDPDDPRAADLHRRQIEAMATLIRQAALRRRRKAEDSDG